MEELFFTVTDFIWGNMYQTIDTFLIIGLIWTFFLIPNIKKKTAPQKGVQSPRPRKKSGSTLKSSDKYSLIFFLIGILFCYFLYEVKNEDRLEWIAFFIEVIIAICFLSTIVMQTLNRRAKKMYINK
jgi:hypothetical protein